MPKTIVKIRRHLVSSRWTSRGKVFRFFLDVVVREGPPILELLASKDQPLLIRRNTLLVLDLGLDVLDGVGGLHLQGNGLAGQGLYEDLHTSSEPKHEMEGALLLDVVIAESTAALELLASEDKPLLVWGNSLLILDLGLDVLDGVRGLHLQGDGLPGQGLHEDLHLLVRGNSLLVLDLSLHVLDGVRGLDLEGDCLPGKGLDENLHFQRFFV